MKTKERIALADVSMLSLHTLRSRKRKLCAADSAYNMAAFRNSTSAREKQSAPRKKPSSSETQKKVKLERT